VEIAPAGATNQTINYGDSINYRLKVTRGTIVDEDIKNFYDQSVTIKVEPEEIYPSTATFDWSVIYTENLIIPAGQWDKDFSLNIIAPSTTDLNRARFKITATCDYNDNRVHEFSDIVTNLNQPPESLDIQINTWEDGRIYGSIINFTGYAEDDGNGSLTYAWDFDDGSDVVTGREPEHIFEAPRAYLVTLTVTDEMGVSSSVVEKVGIKNLPPEFDVSIVSSSVFKDEAVEITLRNFIDEGTIIPTISVNFGDGTVEVLRDVSTENSSVITPHEYASSGDFEISITAVDEYSAPVYKSLSVVVMNQAPTALFTVNPTNPEEDELVTFDASGSSDADGRIVSYEWDFNDGSYAVGSRVDHIFKKDATRQVTLIVTDDDGKSSSKTIPVVVDKKEEAVPLFLWMLIGVLGFFIIIVIFVYVQIARGKLFKEIASEDFAPTIKNYEDIKKVVEKEMKAIQGGGSPLSPNFLSTRLLLRYVEELTKRAGVDSAAVAAAAGMAPGQPTTPAPPPPKRFLPFARKKIDETGSLPDEKPEGDVKMRFCEHCGATLDADAKFCDSCGQEAL